MIDDAGSPIISENFSDIPKKRKVGRPKKWVLYDEVAKINPLAIPDNWNTISRRTQINQELMNKSMSALQWFEGGIEYCQMQGKEGKYNWLYPFKDSQFRHGKHTILYALGRIEDDEIIREIAFVICEQKYSSKNALKFIKIVLADFKRQELPA